MAPIKKLVLIGTGLIAGSFTLALRRARLVKEVVGVDCSEENLRRALELSVIDVASQDAAQSVLGADLVFLGTPVGQMGYLMQSIAPCLEQDCIVTDAGSTKQDVCALYRTCLAEHLAQCVPAHPIAGSDLSGAAAATYGLYEKRRVVLTPLPETSLASSERMRASSMVLVACSAAALTIRPDGGAAGDDACAAAPAELRRDEPPATARSYRNQSRE